MATILYETPLEEVKKIYDDNLFLVYLLDEEGFHAFNIERDCPGSVLEGDTLYLLVTDYDPVTVFGKVIEFPEDITVDFTIEDLKDSGIVEPVTDDIIKKYLSQYELADFDVDAVATDLVQSYGASISEVLEDADKIDVLEYLIP